MEEYIQFQGHGIFIFLGKQSDERMGTLIKFKSPSTVFNCQVSNNKETCAHRLTVSRRFADRQTNSPRTTV